MHISPYNSKPFKNNFKNSQLISSSTNLNGLGGGKNQIWNSTENQLKLDGKNNIIPKEGTSVEVLLKEIENILIVDAPIFLDPKTATWYDIALHAKARQNMCPTTIEKHFRTARFMINHPVPIDLRNLTFESVIKHFDYRRSVENASRDALRHERDAIFMFLRAFKQFRDEWREYVKLPKKRRGTSTPFVLFPQMLNKLYHGSFGKTQYENVLFQTIVFTVANFGMRPPSEIINLDLRNIVINNDGTGYIWIKEEKKGGIERQYIPFDKKVLSSKVYRTPANYINTWRPKVANKHSGNALFLQPNGKRITGKYVRDHISENGKIIVNDNRFKLYTLRHTFATYYYDWTHDIKKVARRLGHNKTDSIDHYIGICDDLKTQLGRQSNLFDQALRHFI
jgi:site-specific recombinase XerD